VRKGGHDIPDDVQLRRFGKGLRLLLEHYRPLLDYWRLFDNTGQNPQLVAEEEDGVLRVKNGSKLAMIEMTEHLRIVPDRLTDKVEEPVAFSPGGESRAAMRAMRRAYAKVVLENKSYGLPVIQWRDGVGVIEVPAEQLEPFARRILEVNGEPLPEEEERALLSHVKS
jgi:hypothetical protein